MGCVGTLTLWSILSAMVRVCFLVAVLAWQPAKMINDVNPKMAIKRLDFFMSFLQKYN
ncbi:hypothetical protein LSAJ156_150002 [Latilactobacillus sakei]|nr:hypothetical protein LSAJ156_150002 [Latilactobacillus sakei]